MLGFRGWHETCDTINSALKAWLAITAINDRLLKPLNYLGYGFLKGRNPFIRFCLLIFYDI